MATPTTDAARWRSAQLNTVWPAMVGMRINPSQARTSLCEKAVNEVPVGVGMRVVDEGVDLGGRRRQAGQVEADAADQRGAIGLGRRADVLLLQPGEDEAIDGIAHPLLVLDDGQDRTLDRLEGPVVGGCLCFLLESLGGVEDEGDGRARAVKNFPTRLDHLNASLVGVVLDITPAATQVRLLLQPEQAQQDRRGPHMPSTNPRRVIALRHQTCCLKNPSNSRASAGQPLAAVH